MESLQGKTTLVIGASGGIGSELCKLLKSSGAELYLTSSRQEKLDLSAASLDLPDSRLFLLDVRAPSDWEVLKASIPLPDIIINASGIGIIKPIDKMEDEDFDKVIDINLKGNFKLLKTFLPDMKQRKTGLIINIPGVLGKTPMAGAAAYAASKYGLNGMLKSVREELKLTQIRITNLYLGGTNTPFWDEIDLPVKRDRFVQAKEAAKAIWFLCQQPSSGVVSEMVLQPFNHQAI
jgi:NAD(P)-dependent dehydrogenase (short-subunit alcohol dehydrogenase family)